MRATLDAFPPLHSAVPFSWANNRSYSHECSPITPPMGVLVADGGLKRKWHGIELQYWYMGGALVVVGGYLLYRRSKAAAAPSTAAPNVTSANTGVDPNTGIPYSTELASAQAAAAQAYGNSPYGSAGGIGGSYGFGDTGSAGSSTNSSMTAGANPPPGPATNVLQAGGTLPPATANVYSALGTVGNNGTLQSVSYGNYKGPLFVSSGGGAYARIQNPQTKLAPGTVVFGDPGWTGG